MVAKLQIINIGALCKHWIFMTLDTRIDCIHMKSQVVLQLLYVIIKHTALIGRYSVCVRVGSDTQIAR